MVSMTYGVLPTEDEFTLAFEEYCPTGSYCIRGDKYVGDCNFTRSELWSELENAVADWSINGNDESGDFCSAVLSTLGFEWI